MDVTYSFDDIEVLEIKQYGEYFYSPFGDKYKHVMYNEEKRTQTLHQIEGDFTHELLELSKQTK